MVAIVDAPSVFVVSLIVPIVDSLAGHLVDCQQLTIRR